MKRLFQIYRLFSCHVHLFCVVGTHEKSYLAAALESIRPGIYEHLHSQKAGGSPSLTLQ